MQINNLNIEDLPPNSSYLIVGGRRSGKSIFVKAASIMQNGLLEKSDFLIVFSLSVNRDFFESFTNNVFIWDETSEDKIQEIIDKQTEHKEKYGKNLQMTIILDDILGDNKSKRNNFLMHLFSVCRHYQINLVYICQTLCYTKEYIRNVDVLVCFMDGIRILGDKEYLKKQILINYIKEEDLDKIESQFGKHEAMVCLLTAERDDNVIFKFKAPSSVLNFTLKEKKNKIDSSKNELNIKEED